MTTKIGPITFFKQVRQEAAKVIWPTRREVFVSAIFVFIMIFFVALFLFGADRLVQFCVWGLINFLEHFFA